MVEGAEMTPDRSRLAARDRFLEGAGPDPLGAPGDQRIVASFPASVA